MKIMVKRAVSKDQTILAIFGKNTKYSFLADDKTLWDSPFLNYEFQKSGVKAIMCELLTVKSEKTIPIEWIFHYAKLYEEYGFAGFGWGVVWKDEKGKIRRYRAVDGIKNDILAPKTLKGVEAKEYLVHLRKPTFMKSIALQNAQPYLNSEASLAFAHNGYFSDHKNYRSNYADRLEGTSDSEVGFHCFSTLLSNEQLAPLEALEQTHQRLGGRANIIVFRQAEDTLLYAGNEDNKMYLFDIEGISCASTSLHSLDDFLFQAIFPTASDIQEIPLFSSCKLIINDKTENKVCSI